MMAMSPSNPLTLTDIEKTQMRQWLENWRRVGPLLDAERIAGVRALTDAEAARMACDLWRFALPVGGDDAEGLLPMKLALRKLDPGL